ncbi:Rrf2 family transcriptional regulator [Virgibacillus sp. NKC19-3]|uniref:RrF2 family transcriptional regulator n=1 Tax=Virgibacillus saliphilus TaxID=2831674 RepID=UPI001C9AF40E|nr:Rrf2 family transcriptional regulator [Virgibacillus sp. NKC19-3]MBY7145109.1 Rrf2 family transcriptional regulator [Virgibacillus sp. NKC19-3]
MKSEFSLTVLSLAMLADSPDQMTTSDVIADSALVHPVRIRKVLAELKKHGYIESKEGSGGGFIPKKCPDQITLDDIYRLTAMDTLKPKCPEGGDHCYIGSNIETVLDKILADTEEQVIAYLRNYSISDVLDLIKKEHVL